MGRRHSANKAAVIVALHVATGAAAGAASGSRLAALLLGPVLHIAGDRVPHRDFHSHRFEIGSGLAGILLLAARRGLLDPATLGAAASSAPDLEHVLPLLRPGGRNSSTTTAGTARVGSRQACSSCSLPRFSRHSACDGVSRCLRSSGKRAGAGRPASPCPSCRWRRTPRQCDVWRRRWPLDRSTSAPTKVGAWPDKEAELDPLSRAQAIITEHDDERGQDSSSCVGGGSQMHS